MECSDQEPKPHQAEPGGEQQSSEQQTPESELPKQPQAVIPNLATQVQELQGQLNTWKQQQEQTFEHLEQELLQKLKKDQTLKEAFEKLYEEMRLYKDNFLKSAIKPVILDLLLLFDNLVRSEKKFAHQQEVGGDLVFLREEMEEILYRQDVEKITKQGTKINRKLQKAVKTVITENPDEDGEIVEVIREGFLWEEKLLRPQEVAIKKYRS